MKKSESYLNDIKKSSRSDRKKITLYLSEAVFNRFKKACEDVAPSRVTERLMKDFVRESSDHK